jgi:sugar phosphate isomerase/epimerase
VAKDFLWGKQDGKWRKQNCPLGQGMVDFAKYRSALDAQKIAVPFSLHLEYSLGGAEHGARELTTSAEHVTTAMRQDLTFLRTWLKQRS